MITSLLLDHPLLLLFLVAAIGYPLGQIRLWGSSLGVAGVLFAGLAIGSLHPDLKLPEIVYELGLSIFVYTVGLSSGPGFFASFRRKGLRDNLLVVSMLAFAAVLVLAAQRLLHLRPALAAGLFSGALTNTPALAGQLDFLRRAVPPGGARETMLADPVVGYSIAYPMGVLGVILAVTLCQRWWRVNYRDEQARLREFGAHDELVSRTVLVTRPVHAGRTIADLVKRHDWDVVFGRIDQDGTLSVITGDTVVGLGARISIVGSPAEVERVTGEFGQRSMKEIDRDRAEVDYRRVFVSNPALAGRRVSDLNLVQRFGAIVTRVKRGDSDFLAHPETTLELGDRVRVLAPPDRLSQVAAFFGDSFRSLSEIDVMTFSLGLALGLLIGIVPIPLGGGVVLTLGFAGGPLLVALVLGWLSRTGPMVWTLPYNANLTLRQVGLILFLAGIGTRAGYAFLTTVQQGSGLAVFVAGAVITFVVAATTLIVGYRVLRIPMTLMVGLVAGVQTQPAVLGFALEQTGNDLPNVGYSSAYPMAMVAKILIGQLVLSMMLR